MFDSKKPNNQVVERPVNREELGPCSICGVRAGVFCRTITLKREMVDLIHVNGGRLIKKETV